MNQSAATLRPLHILIAEDNPVNVRLLVSILRRYGHRITAVENGKAAVAMVEHDGPFDLILMDSTMPVMDGIEATRRIRALTCETSAIPIVAVTALGMRGERERHLAAGMDEYVAKPVT
ncbi:MAG: response regulator, partial [Nannocystaceae bacterium]